MGSTGQGSRSRSPSGWCDTSRPRRLRTRPGEDRWAVGYQGCGASSPPPGLSRCSADRRPCR
ncbi:hypothetical protein [Ornithinimicrobium kibberense]|uniref:hypothetical protein n=1 Tax=Ornithinimicrobium kibberense TaxID=282060 RepID=UPI0036225F0F